MKKQSTHFFLAVPISREIRQYLHNWTEEIKGDYQFKQWVHPEDYHITLSFLGKASVEQLTAVEKAVQKTAADHLSFSLTLNEVNVFGRERSPRIFWIGISESKPLRSLQKDVKTACEKQGFSLETRPYKPHVTVAKKWIDNKVFPYDDVKKVTVGEENLLTWDVEEIVLYETHLNRTPKYDPIKVFKLKS